MLMVMVVILDVKFNLAEIVNPCLQLVIFSLLTMDYDGSFLIRNKVIEIGIRVLKQIHLNNSLFIIPVTNKPADE